MSDFYIAGAEMIIPFLYHFHINISMLALNNGWCQIDIDPALFYYLGDGTPLPKRRRPSKLTLWEALSFVIEIEIR